MCLRDLRPNPTYECNATTAFAPTEAGIPGIDSNAVVRYGVRARSTFAARTAPERD